MPVPPPPCMESDAHLGGAAVRRRLVRLGAVLIGWVGYFPTPAQADRKIADHPVR